MPTYDYQCKKCKAVIELLHKADEPPELVHEGCGGELVRCMNTIQVVNLLSATDFRRTPKTNLTRLRSKVYVVPLRQK